MINIGLPLKIEVLAKFFHLTAASSGDMSFGFDRISCSCTLRNAKLKSHDVMRL